MLGQTIKRKYKVLRDRMRISLMCKISSDNYWLGRHVEHCPSCQKRIELYGRVDMAMGLLKTERHSIDLLARANCQTVNVLRHSLRNTSEAEGLKHVVEEAKWQKKYIPCLSQLSNVAACLLIMICMRAGIFSSIDGLHKQGHNAAKTYYANRLGQSCANDLFGES